MNHLQCCWSDHEPPGFELTRQLLALPPARRGTCLQSAVSFRPSRTLDDSIAIGPLRAAFAEYWESSLGRPVPVEALRDVLDPPVPIKTVLEFSRLMLMRDAEEMNFAIQTLLKYLDDCVRESQRSPQLELFGKQPNRTPDDKRKSVGGKVESLHELVEQGRKFPTVYADPPWPYENESSRAAAVNHYPTMPIDEICREPVRRLVEDNAHLQLWTTNAFLREAFDVIDAWGFEFKSCLVWI